MAWSVIVHFVPYAMVLNALLVAMMMVIVRWEKSVMTTEQGKRALLVQGFAARTLFVNMGSSAKVIPARRTEEDLIVEVVAVEPL